MTELPHDPDRTPRRPPEVSAGDPLRRPADEPPAAGAGAGPAGPRGTVPAGTAADARSSSASAGASATGPSGPGAASAGPSGPSGPSGPGAGPSGPADAAAATPPAGRGPRRLMRATDGRVLGGVAAGLGRYFAIDPVIVRLAFAVTALAGGAGLIAYLAAWLFVGDDRGGSAPAGRGKGAMAAGVALLILACIATGPAIPFAAPGLLLLAAAAAVVVVLLRDRDAPEDTGALLRRFLLALVVVALAAAGAVGVGIAAALGGGTAIAAVLVALGLLTAALGVTGRGRWLLVPALAVAIPLAVVSAADIDADGGIGDRDHRPATVAELRSGYELGAGELIVDLRDVALPQGRTPLNLRLGVGHAVVIVRDGVCVDADVHVGAGRSLVLGRENGGLDVDARAAEPVGDPAAPRLALDADIGAGELEVRRGDQFTGWIADRDPACGAVA